MFDEFSKFDFELEDSGVLIMRFNRPEKLNAVDREAHRQLSKVWTAIGDEPSVRAVVVTGSEKAFCAGGDFDMIQRQIGDFAATAEQIVEAPRIVYGMIDCPKPIVSAISGVAVGAGLVVALMADISVAGVNARLGDGHVRLGLAAGDHAVIVWPMLCGMAKAKYYLMTSAFISGSEADRVGLVSLSVDDNEVFPTALQIARELASAPEYAVRWTKRALGTWLHAAAPSFEASSALELLSFLGPDVQIKLDEIRAGNHRD
jgi:enoyl-CoA hydratase